MLCSMRGSPRRGNTSTLAHYLELLAGAEMLCGISKYAGQVVRQRASIPKLQVLNTGLKTAQSSCSFVKVRREPEEWGRLVESAVGAYLADPRLRDSVSSFTGERLRRRWTSFFSGAKILLPSRSRAGEGENPCRDWRPWTEGLLRQRSCTSGREEFPSMSL